MTYEKEPENLTGPKTAGPFIAEQNLQAVLPSDGAASGTALNFHLPEFNHPDNLTDCSGNYCDFESLEGVITADMQHQIERRENAKCSKPPEEDLLPFRSTDQKSADQSSVDATAPITVISYGRTLIIGRDAGEAIDCGNLLAGKGLKCTILLTSDSTAENVLPDPEDIPLQRVDSVSVTGAFGGFSATTTVNDKQQKLSAIFDLVLDLQSESSYTGDYKPVGYYSPGSEPENLDQVMRELPEMKGKFTKPQFNIFLKNHCFHGRSHRHDCHLCLDECPVGAIHSANGEISVNHSICQGCGACALVCPADAIRMVSPDLKKLLNELQRKIEDKIEQSASSPTVIFTDVDDAVGMFPDLYRDHVDRYVYLEVEQIGRIGMEIFLTALALHAGKIVIACREQTAPAIGKLIKQQVEITGAVLRGLNFPEDTIRFITVASEESDTEEMPGLSPVFMEEPVEFPFRQPFYLPGDDKRSIVRRAAQYLYDRSGGTQAVIPLPEDAPYGSLTINRSACTLCMACAVACPSGALSASENVPRLRFLESDCHQCGLCAKTCPEKAIQLSPRLLLNPAAVYAPVVLHETEPFRCVVCGVPFASKAIIGRIREKLTGHWMYTNDRQLRRLQMCHVCRTRDAFGSKDIKLWRR